MTCSIVCPIFNMFIDIILYTSIHMYSPRFSHTFSHTFPRRISRLVNVLSRYRRNSFHYSSGTGRCMYSQVLIEKDSFLRKCSTISSLLLWVRLLCFTYAPTFHHTLTSDIRHQALPKRLHYRNISAT